MNAEIFNEDEEQLSYLKLKRHIETNHPTDASGKRFSLFTDFGDLPCSNCCFNKKKNKVT